MSENSYAFQIESTGQEYRIVQLGLSGDDYYDRVSGTDGRDSYTLFCGWPSIEDKKVKANYNEVAIISSGTYPNKSCRLIQLLCIAFDPTTRADNQNQLIIEDTEYASVNKVRYQISSDQKTGLLTNIIAVAPAEMNVNNQVVELTGELKSGYTLWKYHVTQYGESNGKSFPQKLEFTLTSPSWNLEKKAWESFQYFSMSIAVTNCELLAAKPASFLPVVRLPAVRVSDLRVPKEVRKRLGLPDNAGSAYTMFGGVWPSRDDPRVASVTAQARLAESYIPPKASILTRLILLGTMLLPMIGLCVFAMRRRSV